MTLQELMHEIVALRRRIMLAEPGTIAHNNLVVALIILQDTYINKVNVLVDFKYAA